MLTVFHTPVLQKQFDTRGYVLFPFFLTKKEVSELIGLFEKFQKEYTGFFHTTHFSTDISHKQAVHDAITVAVFPKAAPYLNDYSPLFGNFMIKNPDPLSPMDMHADWTYVDETKFNSVSIWIPLVDVSEENGCLGIIEGSDKIANDIRGPLIRQSTRNHEKEWEKKYGRLLPMKAGDAIFYNHRLLHYSPPNKTRAARPAVNLSVAPAVAPILHYCLPEGAVEIEMYKVSEPSFFIRYNNFQRPQGEGPQRTFSTQVVEYIDDRMANFRWHRLMSKTKNLFLYS